MTSLPDPVILSFVFGVLAAGLRSNQLLLLGSIPVGWVSGEGGKAAFQPFSGDLFKRKAPALLVHALCSPLMPAVHAAAPGHALA